MTEAATRTVARLAEPGKYFTAIEVEWIRGLLTGWVNPSAFVEIPISEIDAARDAVHTYFRIPLDKLERAT